MRHRLLTSLASAALALSSSTAVSAQCELRFLVPQQGKVSLGKTTISLGEPDSKDQPSAWEGPITTAHCTFDPGVIEQPIAMTPNGWLFIPSYSGSQRSLALYDLKSCAIRWQSDSFAGRLELTSRELALGDKKIKLDDACVPGPTVTGYKSARR
jgi:hypothetical protein